MGHCAWAVRSFRGFCSALAVGDLSQAGSSMDLWLLGVQGFFFCFLFFSFLPPAAMGDLNVGGLAVLPTT